MAMKSDSSLYAVGCRSYTLLLDSRTLHTIKKIPARYSGCGVYISLFINTFFIYNAVNLSNEFFGEMKKY